MGSTDEVEIVLGEELLDDGFTEAVGYAAFVVFPIQGGVGGVGPEEIVEQTVVGDIGGAFDSSNVVHVGERR